jgi:hypothetical protein
LLIYPSTVRRYTIYEYPDQGSLPPAIQYLSLHRSGSITLTDDDDDRQKERRSRECE